MYMYQIDQHFEIVAANKQAAFQALKDWEKRQINRNNLYDTFGRLPLGNATTLEEALSELYWEPETDEEGNVVALCFSGEKSCDEDDWLCVLAPFVARGSYLTMEGEYSNAWRWYFDGETCKEYAGELIFPGCPEDEGNDHRVRDKEG